MTKLKKTAVSVLALASAACITVGAVFYGTDDNSSLGSAVSDAVRSISGESIKTNIEDNFNDDVVQKLPDTISGNDYISLIVSMDGTQSVMDAYYENEADVSVSEYADSKDAAVIARGVTNAAAELQAKLDKAGVDYTAGEEYDTILSGFEITIKARDFDKVSNVIGDEASLIVGEVYEPAATEVVTNEVDVYETGIFDSSNVEYQGDGVVVAVLDTGLDYTHTAFSVDNFHTSDEKFTLANVSEKVSGSGLMAASYSAGLTGEDVYVSKKVPYAYDYADKDSDVFPINSEHGTHVAGIIAGRDDVITGVAPNAQLAIMKVFSDYQDGAKTSCILSALEDCVKLGVDVINMSLGSACGFSREVDEERINEIYDSIKDAGISLIAAASNDYNATFGSEKNGSNALTTNPDSGTVGSPSTYDAALSVASVDGVKTKYLLHEGEIIYFTEASTSSTQTKDFVEELMDTVGEDVVSHDFEYVTIPGVGRASDYIYDNAYYAGKIVLVKRGTTTFEDKVRVALEEKGAAGIIIYNNISGTISMSVGESTGPVCSVSQDVGERLAASQTGIISVSREQTAGPFMSDFSSWGPTSDLRIKPEITAHGGEIYSAVPGQGYDRLSGTSMAAPNQAGATALIRQYVTYSNIFGNFDEDGQLTAGEAKEVTSIVNRLMMSTADIVLNQNGLPYAVRKQGAGLVNIYNSINTPAYITTYDADGNAMDKTKIELGDDKDRTGVYTMTFDVTNISASAVTYDVGATVQTEGISTTYTGHGDQTLSQEGYLLSGATTVVNSVEGAGTQSGNSVTVNAGGTAKVSVTITLSDEDKAYLDQIAEGQDPNDPDAKKVFDHGMYVEGFVTLTPTSGTDIDMNIPMLSFYGDWTEAPIFDEEYYDTNADEINPGIDTDDKLMADAYATRVVGGLYDDYITTLGAYAFNQDPSTTQIAADKDKIAISNQLNGASSAVNSIEYVSAGLLRNAKQVDISIVDDATGEEIFSRTNYNQRKSYSQGSTIYPSYIEVDYSALEDNLKNNTRYTVTVTSYIDYGSNADQKNVRNTFTFPLYIDFQAPAITDVAYRTVYDKTTKKTTYYADISVYDNHYAMGIQLGQIVPSEDPDYVYSLSTFGKYVTPVYSSFNSTSLVSIDLTSYIEQIKQSIGSTAGLGEIEENNNSFIAICYDYAMNSSYYEIRLPDEVIDMAFADENVSLSPNETLDLSTVLSVYPDQTWIQMVDFSSDNPAVADVVNHTLIAKASGDAVITATGLNAEGEEVSVTVAVHVLSEGEDGYFGGYTMPEVNNFSLTKYKVNKAYYDVSSTEREIGVTDGVYDFAGSYSLSMFPSESVTLEYTLDAYDQSKTDVVYTVGNSKVATVDEDGTIVAVAEGSTIVSATVTYDGRNTLYSARVNITVKDPFTSNSIYLMSYKGNGGTVEIPDDRGITTIYAYAFSGYEYVPKDVEAGDVIDEEDPYYLKQSYLGEDTITKIIIPEGVTDIQQYAFAGLTALKEVVLPSTLNRIGINAFYGCTSLRKINLENVQFINKEAFRNTALTEVTFNKAVAIGDYSFANTNLITVDLPSCCQSLGEGAFYGNSYLADVSIKASVIKLGSYAFAQCERLRNMSVNAAVIPAYTFYNSGLVNVTLGKDVAVIGEYAFAGTKIESFSLSGNKVFSARNDGALLYKGNELVIVAPAYNIGTQGVLDLGDATSVATGAFSGNKNIRAVTGQNVTTVGAYAFSDCTSLAMVDLPELTTIGEYAFAGTTSLIEMADIISASQIGAYAFAGSALTSVSIADNAVVGEGAFYECVDLKDVTIGDNVTLGTAAFAMKMYNYENVGAAAVSNPLYYEGYYYNVGRYGNTYYRYIYTSGIETLKVGDNAQIGAYAFSGNTLLEKLELGDGAQIGDYAFYNAKSLSSVDISAATKVGAFAFSGDTVYELMLVRMNGVPVVDEDGNYMFENAYEVEDNGGELPEAVGYLAEYYVPALAVADLSSLAVGGLGTGAFAYNEALASVTLSDNLTSIPDYAFAGTALNSVALPAGVSSVGAYAFASTALTSVDLSNVSYIGAYAFADTPLTAVTLKGAVAGENAAAGAIIDQGAFDVCTELSAVENLGSVSYIGAYAFEGTAITSLTLKDVAYIGDFAFAQSALTSVTFADDCALAALGENPFVGCRISSFGRTEDVLFNDKVVGSQFVTDYAVSPTVEVIGGVLYQSVPSGLELVSYPMAAEAANFVVADGTVRITARAFYNSAVKMVTLSSELRSLGDKAFYGCGNLSIVVFTSYDAPVLEEEYDVDIITYDNMPYTGYIVDGNGNVYEGLGIVPFYMWNVTSDFSNFYYGANFVDYVGHNDSSLVMISPSNGQGYDTFIFGQYFGVNVEGDPAATQSTLEVIALIAKIPAAEDITLADEAAVIAARAAYDQITSVVQQSLVTNYSSLTEAESIIEYLKGGEEEVPPPDDGNGDATQPESNFFADNMVGLIIAGVLLVVVIGLVVYIIIDKKKNKRNA